MKYFLHDTSSFDDEKVYTLYMNFGYEGLGLFYTALEKLAKHEKPIKTSVLKRQLQVGKKLEKCWSFMESLELLSSNNGETFNKRLLNFGESIDKKREKTSKRVSKHRENKEFVKNVTHYSYSSNAPNITEHNNNINNIDSKLSNVCDDEIVIDDPPEEKKTSKPKSAAFKPPTIEEVEEYFLEKTGIGGTTASQFAAKFCGYYQSNGWKVGKNSMKDWKSAMTGTWGDTMREFANKISDQWTKPGQAYTPPKPRSNREAVADAVKSAIEKRGITLTEI